MFFVGPCANAFNEWRRMRKMLNHIKYVLDQLAVCLITQGHDCSITMALYV